jgi:hypothetical protein
LVVDEDGFSLALDATAAFELDFDQAAVASCIAYSTGVSSGRAIGNPQYTYLYTSYRYFLSDDA